MKTNKIKQTQTKKIIYAKYIPSVAVTALQLKKY